MTALMCRILGHDEWRELDGWEGPGAPFRFRLTCSRCGRRTRQDSGIMEHMERQQ